MSGRVPALLFAAALLAAAPRLEAQSASPSECPDSGVVAVSTDTLLSRAVQRLARASIDTTYTLSIARKQWTARELDASVAAGVVGMERASWAACAGARVHIERAELLLENVQGRVRIRASVEPLLEVLRRHSSQTR